MFKKRNRKCQSRPKDEIIDLVHDADEDNIIEIDLYSPKPLKYKSKLTTPKPTTILSFDNEGLLYIIFMIIYIYMSDNFHNCYSILKFHYCLLLDFRYIYYKKYYNNFH